MTLRELFRSISEWWHQMVDTVRLSIWTVQNVNPMDWPLWLFPVVGFLGYIAARIAIAIVVWLFSKHVDESGKQKRGWWIAIESLFEPLGYLAMYVGVSVLVLGTAMSLVLLVVGGPTLSRWWGIVGLVIVGTVVFVARKGFQAYDRAQERRGGEDRTPPRPQ